MSNSACFAPLSPSVLYSIQHARLSFERVKYQFIRHIFGCSCCHFFVGWKHSLRCACNTFFWLSPQNWPSLQLSPHFWSVKGRKGSRHREQVFDYHPNFFSFHQLLNNLWCLWDAFRKEVGKIPKGQTPFPTPLVWEHIFAVLGYFCCFGLFLLFWAILAVMGYFGRFGTFW